LTFSKYILGLLRDRQDGASDTKIGQLLGMSHQNVNRVKNGHHCFSDETLIVIADLLDMDRVEMVARSHIQDDSNHNMRLLWGEILHRSDRCQALDSILKNDDEAA